MKGSALNVLCALCSILPDEKVRQVVGGGGGQASYSAVCLGHVHLGLISVGDNSSFFCKSLHFYNFS
jgi:hypothetical protein